MEVSKNLGQSAPAATTDTDVYTVPALTSTAVSAIFITNRSLTVDSTITIRHRVNGEANSDKQIIFPPATIAKNSVLRLPGGITMAAGDVISVYASTGDLSINIYGLEVS